MSSGHSAVSPNLFQHRNGTPTSRTLHKTTKRHQTCGQEAQEDNIGGYIATWRLACHASVEWNDSSCAKWNWVQSININQMHAYLSEWLHEIRERIAYFSPLLSFKNYIIKNYFLLSFNCFKYLSCYLFKTSYFKILLVKFTMIFFELSWTTNVHLVFALSFMNVLLSKLILI